MSLTDIWHAERKARLARLRATPAPQQTQPPAPKIVPKRKAKIVIPPAPPSDFASDGGAVPIERIRNVTCAHFQVDPVDLISARRSAHLIRPRHIVYYLCKKLTLRSLPVIGRKLGDRDHTTILHGIRRMEKLLADDLGLQEVVADLVKKIGGTDLTHKRKPNTRLNEEQVREIRASKESHAELARRMGISHGAIWHVRTHRTWKHVT